VLAREVRELREEGDPDDAEEEEDEEEDLPGGGVGRGPEEAPGSAVDGGEPVVLDDDGEEEALGMLVMADTKKGKGTPYDDELAPEDGLEERRDRAGGLAVVFGQAKEGEHGECHEQHGHGKADRTDERVGRLRHGDAVAVVGAELGAPVPQPADVDLLDALHRARADHPRPDGRTTCWACQSQVSGMGGMEMNLPSSPKLRAKNMDPLDAAAA